MKKYRFVFSKRDIDDAMDSKNFTPYKEIVLYFYDDDDIGIIELEPIISDFLGSRFDGDNTNDFILLHSFMDELSDDGYIETYSLYYHYKLECFIETRGI